MKDKFFIIIALFILILLIYFSKNKEGLSNQLKDAREATRAAREVVKEAETMVTEADSQMYTANSLPTIKS